MYGLKIVVSHYRSELSVKSPIPSCSMFPYSWGIYLALFPVSSLEMGKKENFDNHIGESIFKIKLVVPGFQTECIHLLLYTVIYILRTVSNLIETSLTS